MKDLLSRVGPYNKAFVAALTPVLSELVQTLIDAGSDWVTGVLTVLAVFVVPNVKPPVTTPIE